MRLKMMGEYFILPRRIGKDGFLSYFLTFGGKLKVHLEMNNINFRILAWYLRRFLHLKNKHFCYWYFEEELPIINLYSINIDTEISEDKPDEF